MERKRVIMLIGIVGILILFLIGSLVFIGNDDGSENIDSVYITIQSYKGQQFQGGTEIKARGLNKYDRPDLRMEMKLPDEKGAVHIWNNERSLYYLYTPSSDTWIAMSKSDLSDDNYVFSGLVDNLQEWAKEYGTGRHSLSYQGNTMEIKINEINPEFSKKVFRPPEGAEIKDPNYNNTQG